MATAPAARADTPDHAKAAAAFKAARAEIAAGRCAAAIPKLEESLAYEPSVGAHLSIADCYEQVDLAAAWRELEEAADLAASKSDPRASVARERAAAIESKIAMVRVVFAPGTDIASADVRVDGNVVRSAIVQRGPFPTAPGTHALDVTAPHKRPFHLQFAAGAPGSRADLNVVLEDESAAPGPSPLPAAPAPAPIAPSTSIVSDAPPPGGSGQRTTAIWVGAAGLAGLAAGAVFGVVALAQNADLRDACGGSVKSCRLQGDPSTVTGPQDTARTMSTLSTVAFIVGGAAVATGVVLYVTAPSGARHLETGLTVSPSAATLTLGGTL